MQFRAPALVPPPPPAARHVPRPIFFLFRPIKVEKRLLSLVDNQCLIQRIIHSHSLPSMSSSRSVAGAPAPDRQAQCLLDACAPSSPRQPKRARSRTIINSSRASLTRSLRQDEVCSPNKNENAKRGRSVFAARIRRCRKSAVNDARRRRTDN